MSKRDYRPEFRGCLEERLLLSGLAGRSAHPAEVSHLQLVQVRDQIQLCFQQFARDRDFTGLQDDIAGAGVIIPYAKVDGLNAKVNQILDRMKSDHAAGDPLAIHTAAYDTLTAARAEVQSRVRLGDLIVR